MAKYEFTNNCESKRALKLSDCEQGDLVSIPDESIHLGIIIDDSSVGFHHCAVVDFDNGEIAEVHENTPCRRYTGTLQLDNKLFEDFI